MKMPSLNFSYLIIGIAMLGAAGMAMAVKPNEKLADRYEKINLEKVIPKTFGDWKIEEIAAPLISPDLQASLNKIYAQTLTRTYINAKGERIMLSIAYGKDQSDSLSVHLPEGCYGGQGFAIQDKVRGILKTAYGQIPVVRLLATKEERSEPITYWVTVGEHAVTDGWNAKKTKLDYALHGLIPDGLLIRVSNITNQPAEGYDLQAQFAETMLSEVAANQRSRLMGLGKS